MQDLWTTSEAVALVESQAEADFRREWRGGIGSIFTLAALAGC